MRTFAILLLSSLCAHAVVSRSQPAPVPTLRISAVAYVGMTKTETTSRYSIGGQALGTDRQKQNTVTLLVSLSNVGKTVAQDVSIEYQYHCRLEDYATGTKTYAAQRIRSQREWSTQLAKQGRITVGTVLPGRTVRLSCPTLTPEWGSHSDRFSNSWGNWETGEHFSHYVVKIFAGGQCIGTHQGNNRTHIRPAER
ncbi:MAG: hypothetical protein Q8Q12_00520 [bacterium]|nr:hypothetical protein [bacterium]